MPHIHKHYDFVVSAFIVHQNKVLLVHHKQANAWLPVGGHIELDEDPEQALYREIQEESGIKADDLILLYSEKPADTKRTKYLVTPNALDVHKINKTHKHIGLTYFLHSKTNQISLAANEHNDIRWFKQSELQSKQFAIYPEVQKYCSDALNLFKTNKANFKTITLCSSVSFYKHVLEIEAKLQDLGFRTLTPVDAQQMQDNSDFDTLSHKKWYKTGDYSKKTEFITSHFKKIEKADAVLIINDKKHGLNGYLGGNVLMEMTLAFYLKIPIYILNPIDEKLALKEEVYGLEPTIINNQLELIR